MFNRLFHKKQTEEDIAKLKDQLIIDAGEFEKLINIDSAWKLYVEKIQARIKKLRDYKAKTKLAMADDKTKKIVEMFEYQADILEWVITMPQQFIDSINRKQEVPIGNA